MGKKDQEFFGSTGDEKKADILTTDGLTPEAIKEVHIHHDDPGLPGVQGVPGDMEDDGERMVFEGGCLREPNTGKGRYDLISPLGFLRILNWDTHDDADEPNNRRIHMAILDHILKFRSGLVRTDHLAAAGYYTCFLIHNEELRAIGGIKDVPYTSFNGVSPFAIMRLAKWYELGAQKYAPRNWESGMSYSRLLDSAQRHLVRWAAGGRTEDHLAAVLWNLVAYMHYEMMGFNQFDDVPKYHAPFPTEELPQPELANEVGTLDGSTPMNAEDEIVNWLCSTTPSKHRSYLVLAVDFDGCLVVNSWPDIGKPNTPLMNALIRLQSQGHKIILWTCREGHMLDEAIQFCGERGLWFDYVNDSCLDDIAQYGNNPRKVNADRYIDDKAICIKYEEDRTHG